MLKMWVDVNGGKRDALRLEQAKQFVLRLFEIFGRKTVGAQAILVAHHHQFIAGIAQAQQGRNNAR